MIIRCPHCFSLEVDSIASINDEDPRIDDFICEECGEMFEYIFPPDYDGDCDDEDAQP